MLQDPKQRRLFSQRDLRDLFTLGEDYGSIRGGGDGLTETSKVTRGVGVVDTEADLSEEAENDDNISTLKKVLKSKGLAGIFDHHSLEYEHKRKSTTVREMEEHAKRVSREAVQALKKSVAQADRFNPTWTGSDDSAPSRFGSNISSHGLVPSSTLLTSLRQRDAYVESDERTNDPKTDAQYTKLLVQLQKYIKLKRPSTDEILKEFGNSISDTEVAIFRGLLKSVARIDNGRWRLIDER